MPLLRHTSPGSPFPRGESPWPLECSLASEDHRGQAWHVSLSSSLTELSPQHVSSSTLVGPRPPGSQLLPACDFPSEDQVPHPAWLSPSALAGLRGHQEQSWAKAPHHEDHGHSVKLGCHAHFRATQPPGYPPSAGCALAQQVSAEPATSDNDRPSLGLSFPIHKMETTIVPSWEACWEVCVSRL